ncbi:hypothetical protein HPB50_010440 [Hyalomma asiaticum]|uniref:Uncharacterized protein n=1 Tax=Hyalomma asiaticum TaxID=266040 RepID=A0ACB7T459_HYAAI|nr:hypothetical protein HPB50_010440 [Hyalomma asiaticum]
MECPVGSDISAMLFYQVPLCCFEEFDTLVYPLSKKHGTYFDHTGDSHVMSEARFYRDALRLKLQTAEDNFNAKKKWRELSTTIDRKAEYLWQHTLFHLRAMTPKKESATNNPVHTQGGVLPEPVRRVLCHGPKLATKSTCSPYDLLTSVRQAARQISEGERDSLENSREEVAADRRPFQVSLASLCDHVT